MKYFKLIGVLIIMFSIVSCTNNDSNKKNNSGDIEETSSSFTQSQLSELSTQVDIDVTLKEIYDRLDNKTHKNQLIKKEYSLDSLQKFARNGNPFYGYAFTVKEIDDTFPIECIRKVSEKFYYVVYKVKEGGYLYVHLINPNKGEWAGQNNGLELSNSYYVKEKSNIKEIKIGDSFLTVSEHDKNIIGNKFNYILKYKDGEEHFYSVHIDSKKLFLISYADCKTIEEIKKSKVNSIDVSSNLIISPEEFKDHNYEYNYNILDIDQ